MSPRKLSDSDRKEIIDLYRSSEETTSTLATRYGVSSSTISRFLKSILSNDEYENLIQQKRLARTPNGVNQLLIANFPSESPRDETLPIKKIYQENIIIPNESPKKLTIDRPQNSPSQFLDSKPLLKQTTKEKPQDEDFIKSKESFYQEMLGEDLADDDEDLDDEDLDDEDLDDEDWEDDLSPEELLNFPKTTNVQVLPLSQAAFPKTCYLVIDRTAELITRPLREFADLGKIPTTEISEKTLPVFDNQRVAKRFSNRSQRVIKVPDARMLQKTSYYLQAKGITRLLIDGQVYSLLSEK